MNIILNIIQRFLGSPKTTSGGVAAGTGLALAASMILEQSGCHFEGVNWWMVMGVIFGGPAVIGGLSTDNGVTLTPVTPIASKISGFWIPTIIFGGMTLALTACASYIDYGGGRYGVTRVSEQPSMFGTNAGFAYLENCQGIQQEGYNYQKLTFVDCHPITPPQLITSQGQGGQIVGGALTGLGFGLGSAFGGSTTSSSSAAGASSSSTSSSSATGIGIGGGGHH